MKSRFRGLKLAGAGCGCLVAGSYLNFYRQDSSRQRLHLANLPSPEVLVGGVNIIPIVKVCFGLLPERLRRHLLLSAAAPKEADIPRDKWDLRHQSPYVLEQVRGDGRRRRRRRDGWEIFKILASRSIPTSGGWNISERII